MTKPYKATEKSGYWVLIDMRTGQPASYPTSKANCQREAQLMNRCYAEALQAA